MPRLGLLLAALTPIRAWWERHAQDSSVLTLSVPAGDSFVRATQKLAAVSYTHLTLPTKRIV